MIYTVTFSPSLDYILTMKSIRLGEVNRTESERILPGGKGINVSIVLKNLGLESTILGFSAGFTGAEIEKRLKDDGCHTDFIYLEDGLSRINVKIKGNPMTDINAQGPYIKKSKLLELYSKLEQLQDGDILVLAGAIPSSLPEYIYEEIMANMQKKDIKIVVDATNQLLVRALRFNPFLIKPNRKELEELFSVKLTLKEDVIRYAKKMQDMGARNVLVSMGGEGAVFVSGDGSVLSADAPQGVVLNTVGAGDSMVAGFLYGYITTDDLKEAFRYSIAAGSASAFSDTLAVKADVEFLRRRI